MTIYVLVANWAGESLIIGSYSFLSMAVKHAKDYFEANLPEPEAVPDWESELEEVKDAFGIDPHGEFHLATLGVGLWFELHGVELCEVDYRGGVSTF